MLGTKTELAEVRERERQAAEDRLREAMKRPPFDIQTAGSTRIQAWRVAMADAQKLLNRQAPQAGQLDEARKNIEWCGDADVRKLAAEFLKDDATGKRRPQPKA